MGDIVIKEANKIFGSDILSGSRKRVHTDGRTAVSNYFRNNLGMPYQKIGRILKRKHCSIISSVRLHESLYKYDHEYKNKYDQLTVIHQYSKIICNTCVYPFNLN